MNIALLKLNAPKFATHFDIDIQLYCAWDNGLFYYENNEWVQTDSELPANLISLNE